MVCLNGGDRSSYRSRGPQTMHAPCGAPYARRRAVGSPDEGVRARRRARGATRASSENTPVPDGSRAGGTRGRHPNVDTRELDRRRLGVSHRLVLAAAAVLAAAPASAQEEAGPLAVQSRGQGGEITIRAIRVDEPLELDGALSEAIYGDVAPASGFIQQDPDNGAPPTEDTEVWVSYDGRNVYVAVRALDSRPGRIVANEMRRDNRNIWLNDNVIIALDTFLDRRSGYFFQTNPLGGVRDGLILDEATNNFDWNTVWDVRSRRAGEGWSPVVARAPVVQPQRRLPAGLGGDPRGPGGSGRDQGPGAPALRHLDPPDGQGRRG